MVLCSLYAKPWLLAKLTQIFMRLCEVLAVAERARRTVSLVYTSTW